MPLTDPIGEPLTKVESLIPGLAPTFAPQLPGIQTNKTLLYQTPGSSSNSEKPNLIETAKPPQSEFSPARKHRVGHVLGDNSRCSREIADESDQVHNVCGASSQILRGAIGQQCVVRPSCSVLAA